ncbi:NYN domain-containing protein [Demequina sp. TTPB684]|uniref:NYN domain-containing protein n=1 Tax=unclassified Demequina TaxID=2620311 RepID=UPI001CF26B27|nr:MULTISPECIES: NYN domain-containing protein [unclassified Demequina]MCB2413067.1 NYN domain-containing protein [Demequina sp. TTPB684]UPU88125.1 NYN domain-containing protein [Demequina sp. TMPB413]
MAEPTHDARLAVLIDADNASAQHLERLLVEIAKYGTATVRRAYGDWTSARLAKWKPELLAHSVQPIQQFAYTTGKNSTDSALIIDAMDLLHGGTVDGFCLVSSDSDFTRLAARIREQGLAAYGFGQKKTPKPFVAACTKFIYVENLGDAEEAPKPAATPEVTATKAKPAVTRTSTATKAKPALQGDTRLAKLLSEAVEASADDDGWAHLGAVGSNLSRLSSDFDSRSWGFAKLTDLLKAHPGFDVESRSPGDGKPKVSVVKRKARK